MPAVIPIAAAMLIASQAIHDIRAERDVSADTVVAFACQETGLPQCVGLNPLAIHDNTSGSSYAPKTHAEAVAIAQKLLAAGHSVDIGVMQVNSANLDAYGLSVSDALIPRRSMAVGARILIAASKSCSAVATASRAVLECIASVYNTGRTSGVVGQRYAAGIMHAGLSVPSIREVIAHRNFPEAAPGTVTAPDARQNTNTLPTGTSRRFGSPFTRPAATGRDMTFTNRKD